MSSIADVRIYPFFDGEGVQIDLYQGKAQEAFGSATFDLTFLAEEFIAEATSGDNEITDPEWCEYAYALIDALREAADMVAAAVDKNVDEDAAD